MTYFVDFNRYFDRGDYRFFLRRNNKNEVSAAKILLRGSGKIDPSMSEEEVMPESLPEDLKAKFVILENGGIPVIEN